MIWDYGKTIQMLSVIVDYVQNCKDNKKEKIEALQVLTEFNERLVKNMKIIQNKKL